MIKRSQSLRNRVLASGGGEVQQIILRSAVSGMNLTGIDNFLTSGYEAVGDYGAGALYTRTGASSGSLMAIQDSTGAWFRLLPVDRVANVCHFGAKGDGVTDDSVALTKANDYLGSIGGGTWYMPPGHYMWPNPLLNYPGIQIYDDVEYCGDGYESWFDCEGINFQSASQDFFQSNFGGYTFYPVGNIAAGDRQVTCTTHANAGNFAAGDMVLIHSGTLMSGVGAGEDIRTFQEVNQVVSASATTGVVTFMDPISDKCTDSPSMTNFHGVINRNVSIRNMRLTAGITGTLVGQVFGFLSFYRGLIENCWVESIQGLAINGFIRSRFRNNYITIVSDSGNGIASAFELKFATHNAIIENNFVQWTSRDGTWPSLYCCNYGEYARRIIDRGNVFSASGQAIFVLNIASAQGVIFEDAHVRAATLTSLAEGYQFGVENDDIQQIIRNIELDIPGAASEGISFLDIGNIILQDLSIKNSISGDALLLDMFNSASLSNILIENVHFNGAVNTSETHSPVYSNVVFASCSFTNTSFGAMSSHTTVALDDVRIYGTSAEIRSTVGNLPTAGSTNTGQRRVVTDATTTTFAATVSSGGAIMVPVTSDGSAWKIG